MKILLVAMLLGADYLYPEFKKDPRPPESVIEELVQDDKKVEIACIPANEECENPSSPLDEAVAEKK